MSETLAANIRAGAPLVYIQAAPGTAGLALAAGAFDRLGITPLIVDLAHRGPADDLATTLAVVGREAGLSGRSLVLGGADAVATDPSLWELVAEAPVPTIAVGTRRWDADWLRWLPFAVVAQRPHPEHREGSWRASLAAVLPDHSDEPRDLRDLAALTLDPEDVQRVVAATAAGANAAGEAISIVGLREMARRLGRVSTQAGAQRRQPHVTFDDLVLPDETLAGLQELVGWALHRDEVFAQGSVTGKGIKGRAILALFGGSPGTGKTLAAQVVASSLALDLLTVELSAMVDKYIGETEKNLERVFQQAESMNCVLFFDEADALFGSRSEVRDARDRYANQEVAYLLQRMETFDGIAILATNLRGNLDPAFSRRLHFVIAFPDPDEHTRVLLWRAHLDGLAAIDPTDPIDPELLGKGYELTGGEIRNVVMAAAYSAATRGEAVGGRHIRRGIEREYAKLARILPELEPSSRAAGATTGTVADNRSSVFEPPTRARRRAAVTVTSRFPSTLSKPGPGSAPGGTR
jgi:hypothetical protein